MTFNYSKLLGKIKEQKKTQREVADYIGRKPNTFNLKVNGKAFFTTQEIESICELLNIEKHEIGDYFFATEVQEN